jgi:hypothetical protein
MSKTPAAAAAPATEKDCLCGAYEIVVEEFENENGEPDYTAEDTGCSARTTRDFAPGHDAKLKSLLISAGVRGLDVRHNAGGVAHMGSAEVMASGFAFSYMVAKGIETGRAKAEVRMNRAAAKKTAAPKAKTTKQASQERADALTKKMAEKIAQAAAPAAPVQEAPAVAPQAAGTTRIKLGRWEYDAVIAANGDAAYTNKQSMAMVAVKGTYKVIG